MNEAALYALEHIDKTVEIDAAISDMKELVFKGFDMAVKEAINDWFGDDWYCDEDANLMEGLVSLYYHRNDDPDWEQVYISLSHGNSGKGSNIWTFLGKNSPVGDSDYFIWLATSEYEEQVSKPQNNNLFEMAEIRKLIASHGFKKNVWRGYFWLAKTISFNSEDILKGLKSEGWEDALSPLKKAWQPLVELDWDEIYRIVNET